MTYRLLCGGDDLHRLVCGGEDLHRLVCGGGDLHRLVCGHKFFQILDCHIPDIVFLTGYWYRNINKARKRLEKPVFIALRQKRRN